jgi:hypothetical protein
MKNLRTSTKPLHLPPQRKMNNTRYIVEVEILDTLNRPKRKRILGVWKSAEDIPYDLIRRANNLAYPGCGVEIKVNAYEGP